jgi:hypothetical protein
LRSDRECGYRSELDLEKARVQAQEFVLLVVAREPATQPRCANYRLVVMMELVA